ncbi:CcdB family protein [Pusillimonas sp. ANT_WB101]|uniref:CcdB family protein n=1 Tax=Pusillimonas sp. ANT_WB101 TaxID=2597356 RepID=UPI0011EC7330|nr:CcdB family protein [Pusillimonas sp. ANT_WB101]KAA0910432.1 plasmid maintenance protein CcdB [Pusillimonas sp. ANT_WB101]
MARFSVYPNPSGPGYLINVQADLMRPFNTRMVVPLLPLSEAPKPAKTLNPLFNIEGVQYSMVTQYMAAVPVKDLKVAAFSVQNRHDDIVAAIDFLFHGF